jgi:DNA-binding transcriptional regulator LsrR (DeoR family)
MMLDSAHHELLARVAAMYYQQELTQNEIAAALDLSRVKIYRLLKEARDAQVVRILIDWPIKRARSFEARLVEQFDLDGALVLQTSASDPALLRRQIAQLAARFLEGALVDHDTMSICFGSTTYEVISAIRIDFQANVNVVQATGSLPHALKEFDSSALTRQLAQKLGGEAHYLSSPLLADSAAAAAVIREQAVVGRTLEQVRRADIALVGIGDLDPATSGFVRAGVADSRQLRAYREAGAIGDMAWQIFDSEGRLFPCELNQRIIGVRLEELRALPQTVAVAVGVNKAAAITGALRTGAIDVLCTDETTAATVLENGL